MVSIEKAIPTHLPVSHVPKDSMNAPKGLGNVKSNADEVRLMGATQATGDPIIRGGEGVNTMGLSPSCRASTATGQEVINLLHEQRVILQLRVLAK